MKPLSQQKLFQELPSPQAKKLLENVTTCDDGKENSCTTFLRQRIKFSTKHTSSLEFPGILQCDCTSNRRFASSYSLQIKIAARINRIAAGFLSRAADSAPRDEQALTIYASARTRRERACAIGTSLLQQDDASELEWDLDSARNTASRGLRGRGFTQPDWFVTSRTGPEIPDDALREQENKKKRERE